MHLQQTLQDLRLCAAGKHAGQPPAVRGGLGERACRSGLGQRKAGTSHHLHDSRHQVSSP